jgi:hypothetical protein
VVLYGYETWSLTLREEQRLRKFENRVLRITFVPKRNRITRGRRKPHNEELRELYSLPNIIRMITSTEMKWAGHEAQIEAKRNAYRLLMEKPEGRRPLGRSRRRWAYNIKMHLGEV